MKPAKAIYTVILVFTVLFGAIVSGLGIVLGWCASQIGVWNAPPPSFEFGTTPTFNYRIKYGPIPYTGLLYSLRVQVGVKMMNTATGEEIANGTDVLNLLPGTSDTLDLNITLYNTTALSHVKAEFLIQGIVTLFTWDWLSVDVFTSFNVTDVGA